MDKENYNGYGYENISTRILPYPLTILTLTNNLGIFYNDLFTDSPSKLF
jgi:hypothetical protein